MNVHFLAKLQTNMHLALVKRGRTSFDADAERNSVTVLQLLASLNGFFGAIIKGAVKRSNVS